MLSRRRMALPCAALIAAASCVALTATADAADPSPAPGAGKTVSSNAKSVSQSTKCRSGQIAIAGGFGFNTEGVQDTSVIANRRTAPNKWTTTTTEAPDGGAVGAVCRKNAEITAVEATAPATGDNIPLVVTARCPAGTAPISGGWEFGDPNTRNSSVFTSRPVRRGWKIRGFADDSTNTLTVSAYCADGVRKREVVSEAGDAVTSGGSPSAEAVCPTGLRLMGGGFGTTPKSDFFNQDGPDYFYTSSQPSGGGWAVQATNYSSYTGESHATAYAVCAA